MKHLKLFLNDIDYHNYAKSDDYIKPNVSYARDTDTVYYNPHSEEDDDFIIMTSESNPAVMDVCYYQGWAASPDVMYKSEAEKVTDIGTAFKGLQGNTNSYDYVIYGYGSNDLTEAFTSFDEFKYFTGVAFIGDQAFYNCSNLTSITIPDSVTKIGNEAFYKCSGLTSIVIPDSVTSIGWSAFEYCSGLTEVTIGSGVTEIGNIVFSNCTSLTSINIPDSVTSIGDGAFNNCSNLTSITIPDSVTSIGMSAFNGCTSLFVVENNLRYIDTYLVGAVTKSLSTYTIKEGTKWIGDNAFRECHNLTSITIPDSVTSIGYGAFSYCNGLTSIVIPDSVTSIGYGAFSYCSNLNVITCLATTAPSVDRPFYAIKKFGRLKYPAGSDYSSWMSTDKYYLGYYNWISQEL